MIKILTFAMNYEGSLMYDLSIVQIGDLEWPFVNESRLDSTCCRGIGDFGVETALRHGNWFEQLAQLNVTLDSE